MNRIGTIHTIVTSDSITLYWDKRVSERAEYKVYLNGELHGSTNTTHYELEGLEAETAFQIYIVKQDENGQKAAEEELCISTGKQKRRRDIKAAPYYAIGDGKTMNTRAIQRAIDDCQADEAVYVPDGVFLTGALRLHSNMELYLEEGGILQGTDTVEDYLPRIPSRFEGIETECYSSLLNLGNLDHDGEFDCSHVVIRGKGTIASGGRILAERMIESERERLKDYLDSLGDKIRECEKPETIR